VAAQPFFFTIAGMALSVAGFAGLMGALRGSDAWTEVELWRFRGIVTLSFVCMFLALLPAPLFLLLRDEATTVAVSSLITASVYAFDALVALRDRARYGWAPWIVAYLVMDTLLGALLLANVVLALTPVLMLVLLVRLAHPVGLFVEAVKAFQPSRRS
jgi:hypothetical protein